MQHWFGFQPVPCALRQQLKSGLVFNFTNYHRVWLGDSDLTRRQSRGHDPYPFPHPSLLNSSLPKPNGGHTTGSPLAWRCRVADDTALLLSIFSLPSCNADFMLLIIWMWTSLHVDISPAGVGQAGKWARGYWGRGSGWVINLWLGYRPPWDMSPPTIWRMPVFYYILSQCKLEIISLGKHNSLYFVNYWWYRPYTVQVKYRGMLKLSTCETVPSLW